MMIKVTVAYCGFIPSALAIFICDYYDQTFIALKTSLKNYNRLLQKYKSGPIFFAEITLPTGR